MKYKTIKLFLIETISSLKSGIIFFIANYIIFSNMKVYKILRGKFLSYALNTKGKICSCGINVQFLLGDSYPIIKGNASLGNNVRFKSCKSDPIIIGTCYISDNCEFHPPVIIGDDVFFNLNCSVFGNSTIGKNCRFGPNVLLVSYNHKIGDSNRRAGEPEFLKIMIGDGVWIGAGTIVLGGVTIGDGAVIGAGSVVVKDIPPNTLALGVPARVVKKLSSLN